MIGAWRDALIRLDGHIHGEMDRELTEAVRSNPAVEVRLLGELRVAINGQPLKAAAWRRRAARQLFKCLVSRTNRRILKEEAIELLWPESEPAAGDSNFRAALSVLRRTLAPIDLLVSDRGSLAIRPGADIWIDADAFHELMAKARSERDPRHVLEEANALYGGDFLAEDVYEDWTAPRRETLRREWTELQFLLARTYEQRGQPDRAATPLERLIHADPSNEPAARELMQLFTRQNRRSDALRVFQNLERALREDFGVAPAASTLDARDQIVAGQESESPIDPCAGGEALPTGTLTFLFTDVEGSSRIWESQPREMRQALIPHDALVQQVIREHQGILVRPRGEGDSRFAVFRQASSAVGAAAALQLAFHEQTWPTSEPLRIRIALNTGEADLRERDYYGPAVNRCARLRSIAYGGQTLLSGITAELVMDELPPDLQLHDLGTHRLKDIDQPERVWQLEHTQSRSGFRPLRSHDVQRHSLPTQLTSLVGRDEAITELCSMTRDNRLLTLTGPGGIGKTRLALAVAQALQDTVGTEARLVELASLQDPDAVLSAVAQAVGAREQPALPLLDAVVESVCIQPLVLVLDNCEHVLSACSQLIVRLLERCPSLRTLATSREPLRVPGEQLWPVPPLEVNVSVAHQEVARSPAVQLFLERALQVQPAFAPDSHAILAIGEICRRLDGIPLAIELAAARVRVLSPQSIAERLDRRLQLLRTESPSVPARQRTLRATIDWSYKLLAPHEQSAFRRMGVFAGGWTIDSAEHLSTANERNGAETIDILARLVDSSLVHSAPDSRCWRLSVRTLSRSLSGVEMNAVRVTPIWHVSWNSQRRRGLRSRGPIRSLGWLGCTKKATTSGERCRGRLKVGRLKPPRAWARRCGSSGAHTALLRKGGDGWNGS